MFLYVTVADPTTWNHLQRRFSRTEPTSADLQDVLDGKEYKKHRRSLSVKANVSLTLNTDGTDVFRSSSASMYPIWLTINELPLFLLVGLWFSKVKPTMATFFAASHRRD